MKHKNKFERINFLDSELSKRTKSTVNVKNRYEEEAEDKKKDDELLKNLDISRDIEYKDRNHQEVFGDDSEAKYFKHYKKLDKIMDQNNFGKNVGI